MRQMRIIKVAWWLQDPSVEQQPRCARALIGDLVISAGLDAEGARERKAEVCVCVSTALRGGNMCNEGTWA